MVFFSFNMNKTIALSLISILLILFITCYFLGGIQFIDISDKIYRTIPPTPHITECKEMTSEYGIIPISPIDTVITKDCSIDTQFTGITTYKCNADGTWSTNSDFCIPEGIIDINADISGEWKTFKIQNINYGPVNITQTGVITGLVQPTNFQSMSEFNNFLLDYKLIASNNRGFSIKSDMPYGKFMNSTRKTIYGGNWLLSR